jgi:hypothetical protein
MKWIGQHIYDLVARFRNDVYLEDLSTTTETNVLVVDSDGKVSKTKVITGDVTGITAGSNITVTDPTGPVPTVALSTNVDVAGTLDVTGLGTFDASVTVAGDVGIGTDEPSGNLHISSGTSEDCLLIIEADIDNNDENDTPQIWFKADGGINEGLIGLNNNTLDLINNVSTSGGIRFLTGSTDNTDTTTPYTGATERMRITSDGIELGHASDTTITRVSAGRIAVEGVNVVTTSSTDTLTNKTLSAPIIAEGVVIEGATSGRTTLQATAVAGSTTLTLPAATDTLVGKATTDTLTNKTLTSPTLTTPALGTPDSGDLTNCTFPTLNQSTTGNADTATKIASITNSDIVQLTETQTLTFKTLNRPTIEHYARFLGSTSGQTRLQATAVAGSTVLILPAETDTLVGKATTDTLTNKTLTAPTITGAGAIAGVFTGNITGNVTGNADTVTTNADLTGPVTSTGNTTTIASGAITTAMQKHLQTFEFNGYLAGTDTNYYFPSAISNNTGPFKHDILGGADGTTAITTQNLIRMGGKVMPYSGTVKLWKGWGTGNIAGSVTIGIFKYTPSATTPPSTSSVALVLVDDTTFTAIAGTASTNSVIGFSESSPVVGFSAGDILMTGIKGISGMTVYFTSTLEVEWD